jgi:glycosyltransferase involved in cell wall biosynthesis
MTPFRLLHVFPGFGPGGAELLMASVMNALGPDFEHTILPLSGRSDAADQVLVPARFLRPPDGWSSPSYALKLYRLVQQERPDLLLTYNWGAIDAVIGISILPPCPAIHNEHGFGPDEVIRLKTRRVLIRRLFLNRIYCTVVVSERLRKIATMQYRISVRKVRLIRNGIDTQLFRPGRNPAWRETNRIPADALVLGFMGGLRPEKRLDFMMQAFAKADLPNAVLVLVGAGSCQPQLERLASELDIAEHVVFTGHTRLPEQAVRGFDVLLMSSSTEQAPVTILQAMACGLPVITTDVGDCGLMVGKGSPVVATDDMPGYVEALRKSRCAEWRTELGAANLLRATTEFSKDRMVEEYRELYCSAITRFRSRTTR